MTATAARTMASRQDHDLRRHRLRWAALGLGLATLGPGCQRMPQAAAQSFGDFTGCTLIDGQLEPVLVGADPLLAPVDPPLMRLEGCDFSFIDAAGRTWTAPAGYQTDGASIPRWAWTVVGGPWTGPYVHGAVIHDWYTDENFAGRQRNTPEAVHRMFYEALRANGVDEGKARLMYWAVDLFGPSWELDGSSRSVDLPPGEQAVLADLFATAHAALSHGADRASVASEVIDLCDAWEQHLARDGQSDLRAAALPAGTSLIRPIGRAELGRVDAERLRQAADELARLLDGGELRGQGDS